MLKEAAVCKPLILTYSSCCCHTWALPCLHSRWCSRTGSHHRHTGRRTPGTSSAEEQNTSFFLFLLLFIEFIFTCLWTTTDYQYVTDVPTILSLLPKQLAAWIFPLGKCSFHTYWVRYLLLEEIYHGKTFSGSSFHNVRIWDSLYYLVLFLISLWSGLFFHSLLHVDRQKYSVNNNNKSD